MKSFFTFGIIFFASRVPFINPGQVFFDSNEYLERFSNPNLFEALSDGHIPLHAGYILLFWPIWHIFEKIYNPALFVIIFQIALSYAGIWAFYKIVGELSSKKIAFLSAIIISLTPLFWITNVTIMMEATYVSCFFIAMWFFAHFLKIREIYSLILGSIFLFISLLTHLAPLLYIPLLVVILVVLGKKYKTPSPHILTLFTVMGITVMGFTFINSFLLDQNSFFNGTKALFFGKTQEASPFELSIQGTGRYARNWLVPMIRNNTTLLFLTALFAFWHAYKMKKWRLVILSFLWILPSFIVNQWSDSLWYGRHALLSYFGIAFFAALFVERKKKSTYLLLLYILIVTVPALLYLKKDVPYMQMQSVVADLPSESLYIDSHYARPQIESIVKRNVFFVNEPRDQGDVMERINSSLQNKTPVYITSQALSDPYGLYSGPYLHILTLSYKNEPALKGILKGKFKLIEHKVISNRDNLIVYQIVKSDEGFVYPGVGSLAESRRRIDFYDPISQLWFRLR